MNKKIILICFFWALLGSAIFCITVYLNLSLNLFSWNFKLDVVTSSFLIAAVIIIFLNYKLAHNTTEKIELWFAFIVSLLLVGTSFYALWGLYNESISHSILGRSQLSPHWFRLSTFLFLAMPSAYWYFLSYKPFNKKSNNSK